MGTPEYSFFHKSCLENRQNKPKSNDFLKENGTGGKGGEREKEEREEKEFLLVSSEIYEYCVTLYYIKKSIHKTIKVLLLLPLLLLLKK